MEIVRLRKAVKAITKQQCDEIHLEVNRLYENKLAAGQSVTEVDIWKQETKFNILQGCL